MRWARGGLLVVLVALSGGALAAPPLSGQHVVEAGVGVDAAFNDVGPLPDPQGPDGRKPLSSVLGPGLRPVVRARWHASGLPRPGMVFTVEIDTDTVGGEITADDVGLPGVSLQMFARAAALSAAQTPWWIQDGVVVRERGFGSSWAVAGGRAAYTVLDRVTLEAELGVRGWLFMRLPTTSIHLRMPAPFLAGEPRVRLRYEGATQDGNRLGLWRGLRGVVEVAADGRVGSRAWGGFDDGKIEARNNLQAGAAPRRVRFDGRMGARVLRGLWLQARGQAGWGVDEDDLSRTPVGGMASSSVDMPGAAWAEYVCERYAAAHVEAGWMPMRFLYAGVSGHLAVVDDPHRAGRPEEVAVLRGLAADVRFGLWGWGVARLQVGGNYDVMRPHDRGAMGVFLWLETGTPR